MHHIFLIMESVVQMLDLSAACSDLHSVTGSGLWLTSQTPVPGPEICISGQNYCSLEDMHNKTQDPHVVPAPWLQFWHFHLKASLERHINKGRSPYQENMPA